MNDSPWFPLYCRDYLADTQHLTAAQSGAYLHLLMTMWLAGGSLPNDERKLARCARVSLKHWRGSIAPDVMPFFIVRDGVITNKRLSKELHKCHMRSSARSLSAQSRYLKNKEPAPAIADTITVTEDSVAKATGADAPPVDVKDQLWREGKTMLVSLGLTSDKAGNMIGRWLKQSKEQHQVVFDAIKLAVDAQTRDPIPFITAILGRAKKVRPGPAPEDYGPMLSKGTDGFFIAYDTKEFAAWFQHYRATNQPRRIWDFEYAERTKGEVWVVALYPSQRPHQ